MRARQNIEPCKRFAQYAVRVCYDYLHFPCNSTGNDRFDHTIRPGYDLRVYRAECNDSRRITESAPRDRYSIAVADYRSIFFIRRILPYRTLPSSKVIIGHAAIGYGYVSTAEKIAQNIRICAVRKTGHQVFKLIAAALIPVNCRHHNVVAEHSLEHINIIVQPSFLRRTVRKCRIGLTQRRQIRYDLICSRGLVESGHIRAIVRIAHTARRIGHILLCPVINARYAARSHLKCKRDIQCQLVITGFRHKTRLIMVVQECDLIIDKVIVLFHRHHRVMEVDHSISAGHGIRQAR